MANRSTTVRRRTAEMTPTATPITSQRTAAPAIRSSVRGARAMISALTEVWPAFNDYAARTERVIPIVILERQNLPSDQDTMITP